MVSAKVHVGDALAAISTAASAGDCRCQTGWVRSWAKSNTSWPEITKWNSLNPCRQRVCWGYAASHKFHFTFKELHSQVLRICSTWTMWKFQHPVASILRQAEMFCLIRGPEWLDQVLRQLPEIFAQAAAREMNGVVEEAQGNYQCY